VARTLLAIALLCSLRSCASRIGSAAARVVILAQYPGLC